MMWKTTHKISDPNRVTGVQTFVVIHDGIVYEKDLGPDPTRHGTKRTPKAGPSSA